MMLYFYSGENVQGFFHRIVALTFDRAVKKEAESNQQKTSQIGDNFISMIIIATLLEINKKICIVQIRLKSVMKM